MNEAEKFPQSKGKMKMKVVNNLKVQHKCLGCELCSKEFFCNLPEAGLKAFESLKVTNIYSKGTTMFVEGQPAKGVYMLCQGRVKLSTCSREGKVIILRIAEAGEVLGLSATISDSVHETTAEALVPCQVNFIEKKNFLNFLQQNPDISLSTVKQLSKEYHKAFDQVRSFGLSQTAADKLAKLLFKWCEKHRNGNKDGSVHFKLSYTHEEIAEMIGTSRETVTRLLKDFRNRNLISLKGSDLTIDDPKKLEKSIGA